MKTEVQERQHTMMGKIMRIMHDHKRVIDRYLSATNLHKSQHRLVMALSYLGKGMSQRDLAVRLNITPAAIAVTVKKLAKDGIIEKKPSEDDMRFNKVEITEKGRQIAKESKQVFEYIDAKMFDGFSEEEMALFEEYLNRVQANLSDVLGKEVLKNEKMDEIR